MWECMFEYTLTRVYSSHSVRRVCASTSGFRVALCLCYRTFPVEGLSHHISLLSHRKTTGAVKKLGGKSKAWHMTRRRRTWCQKMHACKHSMYTRGRQVNAGMSVVWNNLCSCCAGWMPPSWKHDNVKLALSEETAEGSLSYSAHWSSCRSIFRILILHFSYSCSHDGLVWICHVRFSKRSKLLTCVNDP